MKYEPLYDHPYDHPLYINFLRPAAKINHDLKGKYYVDDFSIVDCHKAFKLLFMIACRWPFWHRQIREYYRFCIEFGLTDAQFLDLVSRNHKHGSLKMKTE